MVDENILKARISKVIASTRFPFVGQDDWDETRKTIANDPRRPEWSFNTSEGPLTPSIVVLNSDGTVRECGEVEIKGDFTEEHIKKWSLMSQMTGSGVKYKKFFVYVPEKSADKALRLIEENKIEYAGLRSWRLENWTLIIEPVKTPDMAKDHR